MDPPAARGRLTAALVILSSSPVILSYRLVILSSSLVILSSSLVILSSSPVVLSSSTGDEDYIYYTKAEETEECKYASMLGTLGTQVC